MQKTESFRRGQVAELT